MRLKDRVAIVVGAGQSPGEGIGNGRATALTFAREGAKVLCVDHNLASARETVGEGIPQNPASVVQATMDPPCTRTRSIAVAFPAGTAT